MARQGARCIAAVWVAMLCGCRTADSMLAPASDQATRIARLGHWMAAVGIAGSVLLLIAIGWALWRGRVRGRATADDRGLGKGLGACVLLVVGLLCMFTAASYVTERDLLASPTDAPLQVRITAREWWWQVDYLSTDPSERFTTANTLHLPVGRSARIELASGDVIHSLWIPALAGRADMIPGRTGLVVVTPRREGSYRGECSEFCGLQHAHMTLDVQVEDADAFALWVARQQAPASAPSSAQARAGQQVFASACASCHTVAGTPARGVAGPDLTHLASRRTLAAGVLPLDRTRMAAWILHPQRYKPGTRMPAVPLRAADVDAVAGYLMELR